MGTTTNNGWPTPVATDLVKDGWEAIKDLGDAIDTTLGVYTPSTPGLTLINTTSFSAVASQSINDVFSATYDGYRVVCDLTGSTALATSFRFRVSGADNSTANYQRQSIFNSDATTVSAFRTASGTSWSLVTVNASPIRSNFVIDFTSNPFASIRKGATSSACDSYSSTTPGLVLASFGFNDTTSFTGFSIIASTGNITGSIYTYGFNT